MYKYLQAYSEQNKEKFNEDFILSRSDDDILEYIKDIFKALEILNEIEILDIHLDSDESNFLPVVNNGKYYKPILPSRLNKIHYKIKVTPSKESVLKPILVDEFENIDMSKFDNKEEEELTDNDSFIIEKDLYINKLIDNSFYINEGIRYFLIYQIVDNSTYGTRDAVSLKSLLMPITIMRRQTGYHIENFFDSSAKILDDLPAYDLLLFSKRISPVLYVLGKYAFNSLVTAFPDQKDPDIIRKRQDFKDTTLLDKMNSFFDVDIKISDEPNDLLEDGRTVLKLLKDKKLVSTYLSVDSEKLENRDSNLMMVLGSLADMKLKGKDGRIWFTADDFNSPNFWIEKLSKFFTGNNDPIKKFNKIKTMLISLDRLMDDATRKILNIGEEDKKNSLSVIRYILKNFDRLTQEDNQDLENKRIRLYEYQLYPLRKYFSDQIYRVLNSPTRNKLVLNRIFSNLKPMYIIKKTVVNELLRYYNSTNEMNLYSCLLKYTFRGPQSINKIVSINQRDIHSSYIGRLSLVASSASDPGISGTIVPFVKLHNGYFKKQEKEEE
jgi:hypothetical protein